MHETERQNDAAAAPNPLPEGEGVRLDYAQQPPWHRRRDLHRRLIAGALLVVLLSAVKWAPPAWRHAQLLYWQRQCMSYTAPADEVVFDLADPASGPYNPKAWNNFEQLSSFPRHGRTLFLHSRQTPQGEMRLVHVGLHAFFTATMKFLHFSDARNNIRPASILRHPLRLTSQSDILDIRGERIAIRELEGMVWQDDMLDHLGGEHIRFFAGQPDPDDPSHFTIEYEVDGRRDVIDGWLMEDDTIKLEPRGEWREIK